MLLLTAGHGTLEEDAFASLLEGAGVELLVDVRSHPGSRRHPHFGRDAMSGWLPVDYRWEPRLGGRRKVRRDSPHVALRNDSFRGYADHMESTEFRTALNGVLEEARSARVVVVCAESVWWRCHRRLLSDAALLLEGAQVDHLFHDGRLQPHPATDGVRVDGDRLVYDVVRNPTLPGV